MDGKRCRLLLLPEAGVCRKGQCKSQQHASGAAAVEAGQILALAHPRGGPRPAQYLLSPQGQLCELQSFRPSGHKVFGSWFVEQRVVSDGRLYVASPMDPKFLLLPVLQQHGARFSPLEQILSAAANAPDAAPHAHHGLMALRRCANLDLGKVCDVNDQLGDDMILYRVNEGKALQWLAQKVERTQRALVAVREGEGNGLGSGFAAGFNPNEQHAGGAARRPDSSSSKSSSSSAASVTTKAAMPEPTREQLREALREAVEMVCDYLNDEWNKKLMEHCGLTDEEVKQAADQAKKRNAWESAGGDDQDKAMELMAGKRFKGDGAGGGNGSSSSGSSSGKATAPATTAKQKQLAAASKGVKSISSFFGKKK